MVALRHHHSAGKKNIADESGQALVEFTVILVLTVILALGAIDFGRILSDLEVMSGLTRQGSNLASRGTSLSDSAAAVVSGDAPLDLSRNGEVIVTAVTSVNHVNKITGQVSQGGIVYTSKIGQGVGNLATIPLAAAPMLQTGQTIYVTEVFYSFQAVTPLGNLVKMVMPSTLYEVAYF
jgi:Flp pilus assembly protein TadG